MDSYIFMCLRKVSHSTSGTYILNRGVLCVPKLISHCSICSRKTLLTGKHLTGLRISKYFPKKTQASRFVEKKKKKVPTSFWEYKKKEELF